MAHHRNTFGHKFLDLVLDLHAAFKLHGVGSGLAEKTLRVDEREIGIIIGMHRHISHHQRALHCLGDGLGVIKHRLHCHAKRIFVTEKRHPD